MDAHDDPALFQLVCDVTQLSTGAATRYVRASSSALFSLSEADYERVTALHRTYFRELQAIVAGPTPNEKVALFCTQLVPLARADT